MHLKKHLNFRGNRNAKEITFHLPGSLDNDVIVEVDNYDKQWEYLKLISSDYDEYEVNEWMNKYNVNPDELKELNEFLLDNNMVYLNNQIYDSKHIRTANFLNNYYNSYDRMQIITKMENKSVLVIGLGTVGTSLVKYLMQLGVKNFVLIDGDYVEEKNLIHQQFYTINDVGKPKTQAFRDNILKYNEV